MASNSAAYCVRLTVAPSHSRSVSSGLRTEEAPLGTVYEAQATLSTGNGNWHQNMPPYQVVN